jgi:predicted CXXCH cytochrome family protein
VTGESPGSAAGTSTNDSRPAEQSASPPPEAHASGVIGGVHDFSRFTHRAADVCGACHVPHVQVVRPRTDSTGQTILDLYRIEGQRQVFIPGRYMPGPTSTICISCHNGTVAGSTMSTSHALLFGERPGFESTGDFAIRDHPIGILYPGDPKDYHPQGFVQKQGIPLPEGRIECISCHDPHNEAGNKYLLVTSNKRSALCLTCHKK